LNTRENAPSLKFPHDRGHDPYARVWLLNARSLGVEEANAAMVYRALITVVVWLLGAGSLATDGQAFTHSLIILGACVVGSMPWLPLIPGQPDPRRRAVAIAVVGVSVVAIVGIALTLPKAYEAQRRFNEHAATPNLALPPDGHPPPSARSVARR